MKPLKSPQFFAVRYRALAMPKVAAAAYEPIIPGQPEPTPIDIMLQRIDPTPWIEKTVDPTTDSASECLVDYIACACRANTPLRFSEYEHGKMRLSQQILNYNKNRLLGAIHFDTAYLLGGLRALIECNRQVDPPYPTMPIHELTRGHVGVGPNLITDLQEVDYMTWILWHQMMLKAKLY